MRATNGVARHKRKNRLLKRTKGYFGRRSLLLRLGIEAVKVADRNAFRDRKRLKREMRALWIVRINAAARALGVRYSELMSGLAKAGAVIDRKQLSELATNQPTAFAALVAQAKAALAAAPSAAS